MTLQQYIPLHVWSHQREFKIGLAGQNRFKRRCPIAVYRSRCLHSLRRVVVSERMLFAGAAIALSLLWIGNPVLAHHSESAQFDVSKPVKVAGVISKVEWMNPHIWFYVDVKDESGKVTTWGFSGGPPGMLLRRGITKDVLKIGSEVNVEGSRAKDGSNNASGRKVTFRDGRDVFTASAEDVAR
jgi:hypothetical protein